jgi:transcriptional regulator with XRE-family HTH domain
MKAGSILKRARKISRISQRELADRSGIAQPVIARIETNRASPRADTLDRLLASCGFDLALVPRAGRGIDRTAIRELARLSPADRLHTAAREANALNRLPLLERS